MIDHGASLYFHHGWAGGVTDPARFAAQPWDADRPRLRDLRRPRPGAGRRDLRVAGPRGLHRGPRRRARRVARAGAGRRRCRQLGPDALRAAYVDFLVARLGTRQWLPGGASMRQRLPVRRAALRAATRPRGVPQRRRGAALPGGRLPRRRVPRRRRPAARAARRDRRRAGARGAAFVDLVCAGDERAGEAARQSLGQRFGFLKAPRSTVLQPGPVHGGVTEDPARQLEHLRERLVG